MEKDPITEKKRICTICGKEITKGQRAFGLLNFARPDAPIREAHAECYHKRNQ